MSRLRIAHVIVQPVLVLDDGEHLSPGPAAQPQQVALADLGGLTERLRAEIERLNEQASGAEVGE